LVIGAAPAALALQPLITDDTGTQGSGGNQIELSYSSLIDRESGNRATTKSLTATYTRGLGETLDAYASLAAVRFRTEPPSDPGDGWGNPVVGLKWRFYEHESEQLSFALKPRLRPAISHAAEREGLGAARANAGIALVATKAAAFGALHANLAVDSNRFGTAENRSAYRNALWRLSAAATIDVADRWQLVGDAGLITNPIRSEPARTGYAELGMVYAPNEDVEFALGYVRDVHLRGHKVNNVLAGMTWRFR
jgi:hypothetical protein